MKKYSFFVAGGILLVLLAVVFFVTRQNDDTVVDSRIIIESDDGTAVLKVEESSLPDGLTPADISITRVHDDALPLLDPKEDELIAYRLEPDGTSFSAPAVFETTFDYVVDGIPEAMLVSDQDVEFVDDALVEIDLGEQITHLSLPVPHFSFLTIGTGSVEALSNFKAVAQAPDTFIPDVIAATATVTELPDKIQAFEFSWGRTERSMTPHSAQILGSISTDSSYAVSPPLSLFDGYPPKSAFSGSYTIVPTVYSCAHSGEAQIIFKTLMLYETVITYFSPEGEVKREVTEDSATRIEIKTPYFECKIRPMETALSYEHTVPGSYSTVFLDMVGHPGSEVEVTLTGPGVVGTSTRSVTLESDGKARVQWEINRYGRYAVDVEVDVYPANKANETETVTDAITVQ